MMVSAAGFELATHALKASLKPFNTNNLYVQLTPCTTQQNQRDAKQDMDLGAEKGASNLTK